ncbi:hypothetical protein XBKB1_2060002 [Xenorhabdus bovienii str. kraussei Becker Underwood]|uniref:Uncharacterized protein n=1 Tax=Xenorhabdus bovienii str. kraussei Becker Underwood TaxID=1398204 RepID=A0A077PRY3_XENBV|nr:hypothetical protein XBKB1_2060002 [Xenorhabdus bovienii str. kraussei Becker Underwood]
MSVMELHNLLLSLMKRAYDSFELALHWSDLTMEIPISYFVVLLSPYEKCSIFRISIGIGS